MKQLIKKIADFGRGFEMPNRFFRSLRIGIGSSLHNFATDSLFRNAVYLMASTGIMSVLGFGFWIFTAHLYSPADIGLASALISISILISNLSMLGLNAGILRFLSKSKNKSGDINAAILTVTLLTLVVSAIYLLTGASNNLPLLSSDFDEKIIFAVLMIGVTLNSLTDSIFISSRRAEFHTAAYACFGIVKLILPLFLVHYGSLGIFMAYISAVLISLFVSFILMATGCDYRALTLPNWKFVAKSRKYAINNYLNTLLAGLPSQLMPVIIISSLGMAQSAYFSMAWAMAGLLYVIPSAITNSLLAESSHEPAKQNRNLKNASAILIKVLLPVIALSVAVAPYLLQLFGKQYADGGVELFRIMAVTTIFISGNLIGNAVINIKQRTGILVAVQAAIALVSLSLALILSRHGLTGIGFAMLLGQLTGNVIYIYIFKGALLFKKARKPSPDLAVIEDFLEKYGLTRVEIGHDLGGGDRSATVIVQHKQAKYVGKIFSTSKRSTSQLEEELRFIEFLRNRGIPSPQILPNLFGNKITSDQKKNASWIGILMDYEEGAHPTYVDVTILENIAKMQALMHLNGTDYLRKNPKSTEIYSHGAMGSALLNWLPKGMSHFDYYSNNILIKNNKVSSILDFEGIRSGPLVVCTLYSLMRIYNTQKNPQLLTCYLNQYQTVRKQNFTEKLVIKLVLALRYHQFNLFFLQF